MYSLYPPVEQTTCQIGRDIVPLPLIPPQRRHALRRGFRGEPQPAIGQAAAPHLRLVGQKQRPAVLYLAPAAVGPYSQAIAANGVIYTSGQVPIDPATGKNKKLAHPNSRFTAPAVNCPCVSPEFNNPDGVPVSAIIFGGRRASTTPLVYQSFDWVHGTYMGSAVSSETTAAATGAVGVLRHDPMAMKPFIGYNVGDYWAHWLEMGEKLGDKAPKIFNVNWFKQDENGNFIWPGFGDNMRVLDWIIKRVEGKVDAVETPIGFLPKKGDINLKGIEDEVTSEVEDKLLAVDVDLWKKEIAEMRRYYNDDIKAKGGNIPQALFDELDKIEARLNKA